MSRAPCRPYFHVPYVVVSDRLKNGQQRSSSRHHQPFMSRARLVKSNRMQTWRFQAWSLETHWILERFINESLNSGTELDICGPKVLNSSRFIKHWRFVKTTSLGLNQKSEQLRSRTKAGLSGCIRGSPSDVDFKIISIYFYNASKIGSNNI